MFFSKSFALLNFFYIENRKCVLNTREAAEYVLGWCLLIDSLSCEIHAEVVHGKLINDIVSSLCILPKPDTLFASSMTVTSSCLQLSLFIPISLPSFTFHLYNLLGLFHNTVSRIVLRLHLFHIFHLPLLINYCSIRCKLFPTQSVLLLSGQVLQKRISSPLTLGVLVTI